MGLPCTHSSPLIRGLELPLIGSTGRKISYWSPLRESGLPNYLLLIYLIFFLIFQIFLMESFFEMFHMARQQDCLHMQHFFWFKMDGWMDGWQALHATFYLLKCKCHLQWAVLSPRTSSSLCLMPSILPREVKPQCVSANFLSCSAFQIVHYVSVSLLQNKQY